MWLHVKYLQLTQQRRIAVLGHPVSHSSSWGEDLATMWPRLWWFQHVPGFESSTQIKEVTIFSKEAMIFTCTWMFYYTQ
jgi:hypothetical protein